MEYLAKRASFIYLNFHLKVIYCELKYTVQQFTSDHTLIHKHYL